MAENQNDILGVQPTSGFSHRYLDPNHPSVNNGLIGILSGGHITQDPEKKKQRKISSLADEEHRIQEEYQQRIDEVNGWTGHSEKDKQRQLYQYEGQYAKSLESIRRKMREAEDLRQIKKNILYLTIVNMPTSVQLASAEAKLHGSASEIVRSTEA